MNEDFTWIYGLWFCPGDMQDWMGMPGIEDGKWTFRYRFKYYHPDSRDPHDGLDRRSTYAVVAKNGNVEERDALLATIRELVPRIEVEYNAEVDFILFDCDNNSPQVIEKIRTRPWAHCKFVKTK